MRGFFRFMEWKWFSIKINVCFGINIFPSNIIIHKLYKQINNNSSVRRTWKTFRNAYGWRWANVRTLKLGMFSYLFIYSFAQIFIISNQYANNKHKFLTWNTDKCINSIPSTQSVIDNNACGNEGPFYVQIPIYMIHHPITLMF